MGIPSHLRLRQFRNYTELDLSLSPGLNVIVGRNGQGKSNILEALCYLGLLRSFRTHRVACLRQWHRDCFNISGSFVPLDPAALPFSLEVEYGERRILRLNGRPVGRASEFVNRFLCVPCVPEDIGMIKGPASGRRRFMDIVMSQLDSAYMGELQHYQTALRERNILLRSPDRYPASALAAYDRLLARFGAGILLKREKFVREFDEVVKELSMRLLSGDGEYSVRYAWGLPASLLAAGEKTLADLAETLFDFLQHGVEQDRREGSTRYGPHRADLLLFFDGRPLGFYGSEGERRLASLILRLGSMRLMEEAAAGRSRGITLLVDDVLGELDSTRVEAFIEVISGAAQILLTGTELPTALERRAAQVFHVEKGTVSAS